MRAPRPRTAPFTPIKVAEVELSRPLPPGPDLVDPRRYHRAFVLVRLHGEPLGTVELDLRAPDDASNVLPAVIERTLGPAIANHLALDGADRAFSFRADGSVDAPEACPRAQLLGSLALTTVVVATRDRPESLRECLESLLRMDHPQFEIVVVDSAPTTTATMDAVRSAAGSDVPVRYVREGEPGLARARNRGVREARGHIIAFTDDDVRVDRGWLTALSIAFDSAPSVRCVTGLGLPAELETPAQVWFEQFGGFSKGFERQVFDLRSHREREPLYPYKVGWFGSGLNMAFTALTLEELGGFDEHFGAGTRVRGGEDLDAFLRVILTGGRLVYEPRALVWHYHRRDVRALCRQVHGSGVGLSAIFAKLLVEGPRRRDLFGRLVPGLRYLFSPKSAKNRRKVPDFPKSLTIAELAGAGAGPVIYTYSRLRDRRPPAARANS